MPSSQEMYQAYSTAPGSEWGHTTLGSKFLVSLVYLHHSTYTSYLPT